ncbi:MAG: prolyl oligopeptidase family serine peptidase [Marinifilaceae bacterium]|jgi:dipeptidyl aminopeptidase/acylaminoacyl peptidase|nr:prolyl oligopeptidase family serine peptidase [Marinifilaceae bacterium]
MKRIIFLLAIVFSLASQAQKANFEAAFKYKGDNLSKYVDLYQSINWIGESSYFYYKYSSVDGIKYYICNAKTKSKKELFDVNDLAIKITEITHQACDIYNFNIYPQVNLKKNIFTFRIHKHELEYNMITKKLSIHKKEKANNQRPAYKRSKEPWKRYPKDSSCYVYALDHNLYWGKKGDKEAKQITFDGEKYFSFAGKRDVDTEGKTYPSLTFFGDSKKAYKLRIDKRKIGECFLINSLSKHPKLKTYKFPYPGDKYVENYYLTILDTKTGKVIHPDISKYPDQKVKIRWCDKNENSKYLYFTRKSRTCDQMDLCRVDTETGEVFEIIHEVSKPYLMDQLFHVEIMNDGEDILWWSERTGWGQYYLYNKDGKLKNALTKEKFVCDKPMKIDRENRVLYFAAYGRDKSIQPSYKMFYKVNFDGTGFRLLTPGNGTHDMNIASNNEYISDKMSRADLEPVTIIRDMNGKKIMEIEKPDMSMLYQTGWKKPEIIKVKAADMKTDLYGIMYKPFDFDPKKKYPIISNVYPGPQDDLIPKAFTIDDNQNSSLAQLGFIVIKMEHRGSSVYRNKHYHNFGYGNLRDYALADDKSAIEQLADRYDFIDIDRVGIYGHSGGGFMSTAAILTYPDFYKVAFAASGNHDNNIYTRWWNETHHGVKQIEKKHGKDSVSYEFKIKVPTNMELAKNLKGDLMLLTGDYDINVHPSHTYRMVNALIKANKRFDLMVLPGKDHGVQCDYYYNLIKYYFAEKLLGDTRKNIDMYNIK